MQLLAHRAKLWASLGALAYVLSFPAWDLYWLSLLTLPAYLLALRSLRSRKEALLVGLICSFMIGLGGFHWITYVMQNFGGMPLWLAVLALLFFCVVASPHTVLFFLLGYELRYRIEKYKTIKLFFWPALYVALEFLTHFVRIFPEHIGNVWIHQLEIAQLASLGGVALLSFFCLLPGSAAAYAYWDKRYRPLLACLLLFPLAYVWGSQEIKSWEKKEGKSIKISLVQPNLPEIEKMIPSLGVRGAIDKTMQHQLLMSKKASLERPDLIIWPETSYPLQFPARTGFAGSSYADGYAKLMMMTARDLGSALLVGGYEQDARGDYNAAFLVGSDGSVQGSYRKVKLLLFGEYIPFSDWFPSLKELNPMAGNFALGEGAVTLPWNQKGENFLLGINICYEAIMPQFVREQAKRGASLIVNLTKDSWFGPTIEPYQHLQLAHLRAIENRIPLVRSTNTGFSVFISPTGKVEKQSKLFQEEILTHTVLITASFSLYRLIGDLFAWGCVLFCFALVLPHFWRQNRR